MRTFHLTRRSAVTRRRGAWAATSLLAGYAVLAVLWRMAVWQSPAQIIAGGGGDPLQSAWFLRWLPYAATHQANPFLTYQVNVPSGANLLWNTSEPLAALVLWPVTIAGNAFLSYNVLVTAAMPLAAWLAYLLIRHAVTARAAAAVGGLVFGFSPLMVAEEAGHAQVVASAASVPLATMLLLELFVRRRRPWWQPGMLLGLLLIAQFYLFEEYFVTLIFAGAVLSATLLVFRVAKREHLSHALRAVGLAAAMVVVAIAYPVWLQLAGPDVVHGSVHSPSGYSTDLANFIIPTQRMLFAPHALQPIAARFPGNQSEQLAYLGVPMLVLLAAVVVWVRENAWVRVAAVAGTVIAICSLGPELVVAGHRLPIPLPWAVPTVTPLLRNILPARLLMYTWLAVAVVAAVGLDKLWCAERRRTRLLGGALLVIALVPLVPRLPLPYQRVPLATFFTTAALDVVPRGAIVYTIPWPQSTTMDAMDGQVVSDDRFRILGGYFIGPVAPGQQALRTAAVTLSQGGTLAPGLIREVRRELNANHVNVVMLTPLSSQTAVAAYLDRLFGSPAADTGGVIVWDLQPESREPSSR